MQNPNNTIVVWYPDYGLRVRSCQTTVYPDGVDRRDIIDAKKRAIGYNKWATYIHGEIAAMSGTGEANLSEAKKLLSKPRVTK